MRIKPSLVSRLTAVALGCTLLGTMAGAQVRQARQTTPPATAADFAVSPLETRVLGQRTWLRGGPAALRVIVTDHNTGKPVKANVTLTLQKLENGKPTDPVHTLANGQTNGVGTLEAGFTAPKTDPGPYQLNIAVKSPLGTDTVSQPIQLQESMQLMLTSDKPLYQPGQIIHLRALALDMATRQAVSEQPVTFEVEDARGNKVFKKKQTLSKFGIAGTDFVLADEVNMGTFTLRAVLPQGQTEKKVRVERYVLPKFKTVLTTDKNFYLPGETVKGTLQANYFFGKPVSDGQVTLTVNTLIIGIEKLGEVKGKTDATGKYTFEYKLPNAFVGQPFEQGKAIVEFTGDLKDTADHKQMVQATVPVVKNPLTLVMVPEHRGLVPDVENRIFIAVATPDGTPLKRTVVRVVRQETTLTPGANPRPVNEKDTEERVTTDDLGIATYIFKASAKPTRLVCTATDLNGRQGTVADTLQITPGQEGIILRAERTLAKVGERLNLTALSSSKGGTLYLDVIRNKQTILTHAQPMNAGESHIALPITLDMVGTLEIHAYKILPNEQIIRDTRTVVVSPADDLLINILADRGQYKPGGDAVLQFTVQDTQKRPVLAALGLAMVDESVFALSELQPGLEKIYFTLEKELMEPKYEIHGLKPTFLMQAGPAVLRDADKQRAAAMLLAAAPQRADFEIRVDTYQTRWAAMAMKLVQQMQQTHQKIVNAIQKYRTDTKTSLTAAESLMHLVEKSYLQEKDLLDPWGHFYKTDLFNAQNYDGYFALNCAGPDGKWETADDVNGVSIYGWRSGGRRRVGRGDLLFDGPAGPGGDFGEPGPPGAFGGGQGGFGGGGAAFAEDAARPGQPMVLAMRAMAVDKAETKSQGAPGGGGDAPRIREYFPETMYWNPALITDEKGHAELRIPMADSITTWRLSALANTPAGQLGSATSAIKVFQDFFVDLDLPISLTQDDKVEIPVAVYNYLPVAQDVTLNLDTQPWFTLQGPAKQTVKIEAGQVKVVHYPIVVKAIGRHALTVTAKGSKLSDAIRRQIDVTPNGKQFDVAINDRLEGKSSKTLTIPADAIKGANAIWVKLYPGTFSQVVEGLDGILRMPNGCFEQTSSTTYPNILVLDYLKTNKKLNPELQMKAEQYINIGYQRLVTFECKAGGFSWFGNEPAHQILTAYGLLEFGDMSKVHEVDPALIQRTQGWLASQQKPDGTWEEKNQGIAEGIINRQTGALRSTAYIAWALAESGYNGPQIATGVGYVKEHRQEAKDPYTLAVILNLLTKVERDGDSTAAVANDLIQLAKTDDKAAWWQSDTQTFTGAKNEGADLETTGLAAYGLVKWGRNAGFTNKVLTYLVQSKDSYGTWQSTQGTVWAMKSLLFASRNGVGGGKGTVTVFANGQKAGSFAITPDDSDVMRQVDLREQIKEGDNAITLQYEGDGSLLYQISGRYYRPWDRVAPPPINFQPLTLGVAYDKTTLAQDDTATVTVTIHNETVSVAEMPLIDVGVPPGFTVVPDKLEDAVKANKISKYTVAGRQVIIYMEKLDPNQTVTLTYQIKAKYPIKAKTPLSKAYPYYNPERVAIAAPQDITVNR